MMKKSMILLIVVLAFIIILLPYVMIFFNSSFSINSQDWGAFGSYVNGLLMPVLTLINIFVLVGVANSVSKFADQDKNHKRKLKQLNKQKLVNEYKITINPNATIEENFYKLIKEIDQINIYLEKFRKSDENCMDDLNNLFEKLGLSKEIINKIPYYENPFFNRNWEFHSLGVNNTNSIIFLNLRQLKVNMYKLLSEKEPNNNYFQEQLNIARQELECLHDGASFVD